VELQQEEQPQQQPLLPLLLQPLLRLGLQLLLQHSPLQ
jgi:hypothetical protein